MSKMEELKKLNADKKAINEKAKALREELNAGKEERKEARKAQAQARKDVQGNKSALAKQTAAIFSTFTEGHVDNLNALADAIVEHATALAGNVRAFAEAQEQIEGL